MLSLYLELEARMLSCTNRAVRTWTSVREEIIIAAQERHEELEAWYFLEEDFSVDPALADDSDSDNSDYNESQRWNWDFWSYDGLELGLRQYRPLYY